MGDYSFLNCETTRRGDAERDIGRVVFLAGAGAAWAEKYAPTITSYVESAAQQQQMAQTDEAFDKGDYETVKRVPAPLVESDQPQGTRVDRALLYLTKLAGIRLCELSDV